MSLNSLREDLETIDNIINIIKDTKIDTYLNDDEDIIKFYILLYKIKINITCTLNKEELKALYKIN